MVRDRPIPDRPAPSGPRLVGPIRWERAPKPGGGVRPLVRLDPADARRYASAVRLVAPFVVRAGGPETHANRLAGWDTAGPVLEAWRVARVRWLREARRLARDAGVVITTDVRACYPSVRADALRTRLLALGAPADLVAPVNAWLRAFDAVGVAGLPVGPDPSAVLADAVLLIGDEALRSTGVPHIRWVDDVAIFAADRREAMVALDVLVASWASTGLEPHEGKTVVHRDPGAWAAASAHRASPAGASTLR
jgi:hypothetical protein